jgi:hypothetical protein
VTEELKRLREQTRTPTQFNDDYDWRKEPWVDDEKLRNLSQYIAHHILTAMRADGDNKQEQEDDRVWLLLSPVLTEKTWKSPQASEIIRYREVCAAAMGIDKMISQWLHRFGSIDHPGPPRKFN